MAEKSGSNESRVELREKIRRSRELVARDLGGLRNELNFPLKFKKAFQRHTVLWVGSAIAVGLLVALLRARTRKIYLSAGGGKVRSPNKALLESGALLGAIKIGMTFLQPILMNYAAKKFGQKKSHSSSRPWGR
ncbi:MAG TPA: hypothetical protein VGI85_01980 [Chthoniobacterales bacterium]